MCFVSCSSSMSVAVGSTFLHQMSRREKHKYKDDYGTRSRNLGSCGRQFSKQLHDRHREIKTQSAQRTTKESQCLTFGNCITQRCSECCWWVTRKLRSSPFSLSFASCLRFDKFAAAKQDVQLSENSFHASLFKMVN